MIRDSTIRSWPLAPHGTRCRDCKHDVPLFMLRNDVWAMTGLEPTGGVLCRECVERRIGRALAPTDFVWS